MQTIYKMPLSISDHQTLKLPKGYQLLHVAFQGRAVFAWALLDPKAPATETLNIAIMGTGREFAATGYRHFTTDTSTEFVMHVFIKEG